MNLAMTDIESPLGDLRLAATEHGVCGLSFVDCWDRVQRNLARRIGSFTTSEMSASHPVVEALTEYFAGTIDALRAVRVDVAGTEFQERVWNILRSIPVGETATYEEIALRVDCPRAARAVGQANGANPVWLVLPCHRVVRRGGDLGGYGGGQPRKRWLLEHERADVVCRDESQQLQLL